MYPIHPAAAVLPMMVEKELSDLTDDIRKHGLKKPIELYEGQILDGRNRLEACRRAGVEPCYCDVTNEATDPRHYVASVNLQRRNLTPDARAAIIAELLKMPPGRPSKGKVSADTFSAEQAAKVAGVSESTIHRAKRRMRTDPAAHQAAKAGRRQARPSRPARRQQPASVLTEGEYALLFACLDPARSDRPTNEHLAQALEILKRFAPKSVQTS